METLSRFVPRVTPQVPLVEQELLTIRENLTGFNVVYKLEAQ
jgi:hypothetical protein